MTLTGAQLLTGFGTFIDDYLASTTTGAGLTNGTTLVDSALDQYGDDRLAGMYVRITNSGSNQYEVSRVTGFQSISGTVTVSPPFSAQVASAITYELHKFEPRKKFAALDSARLSIANDVFRLIVDDTITTDGFTNEFAAPSSMHRPAVVYIERLPWSPIMVWNFLPSPQCDEGMANWTATNATLSTYTRVPQDRFVPKYGPACTKIAISTSTGTVDCPIGKMLTPLTASYAAGRAMTYAHWIYCTQANDLTLKILDDTGTVATSNAHQGKGWEFLTVSGNITYNNATTLSVRIDEASPGEVTAYANNAWFYFGQPSMVVSNFYEDIPARIRYDDTAKTLILPEAPPERRQLRVLGKEPLTALGTNTTTQVTNAMEVDTETAEILYAEAARILFGEETINTQNYPEIAQRIQFANGRLQNIRKNWNLTMPVSRISSPYQR